MAATIKDIARKTGLGLATISSYLNGGNVREKNRIKIEEAIRELHFQVNETARGLKTNRTKTIGVVLPELNDGMFAKIISGIEDTLQQHGYATIIRDCRTDPELEREAVEFLLQKRVDGLISIPVDAAGGHLKGFLKSGKPVVLVDRRIDGLNCDSVCVDNRESMRQATELLLRMGHQEIGIIAGPRDVYTSQERLAGYREALEWSGVSLPETYVFRGDYTIAGGAKGMKSLIRENPGMTAVLVSDYEMTMGAVIAINELGLAVPDDISLIGYDNLEFARACRPRLTIVRQPVQEIAGWAAELMLRRLDPGQKQGREYVRLDTSVVEGKSVRKISIQERQKKERKQNSMGKYLMGIDLGTSSCKVAVFERSGRVAASASEEYPVYYPHPGWAEQNSEEWWEAVCRGIRRIFADGTVRSDEIAAVGIDGQSWSAIPIDRKGRVLANTPIWMDTRAQEICDRLNDQIGRRRIFELAGNSLQPSYTTAKVLWYREHMPEVYDKTDKILQSNGYLVYKLTGAVTQDICQGYGWHCFNMRSGEWDFAMAREMGIPEKFLPPIMACDAVAGTVTETAAASTGLKAGTPVVAGGLDAACGTLGAGVIHAGETQEQGGQAGGMSICTDTYRADDRLILSYHVIPGKWLLQGGTVGGGGVMRWFEKEFAGWERAEGERLGKSSLDLLNEEAAAIAPGSDGLVFLPYMSGERSPIWDPDAKGVFYGLDFSKTKGHMVRACMEGVAFALKHNLDVAEQAGAEAKVLRAMGGAANSRLWTQIKADVTGKPIAVPASDTATTLGAAILAGVGTGFYSSYEEAVRMTVCETRRHEPDMANHERYRKNYEIYLELYGALKGLMKKTGGRES